MISRPNGIACSLILAVLLSMPSILLAGDFSKRLDDAFKRADKDKDGTLDRNEAKGLPQVSKHFDRIDVNKSGAISLTEIKAYLKQASKSIQEKGKDAFQSADKDKNGKLSREEAKAWPKISRNFDKVDADKDGSVSEAEIRAYLKSHPGTMKGTPRPQ
jgi:Ca2+-binding EF-hand superfamily protein